MYDLISKFYVGLKFFLCHGLSKTELYGDLVYKLKKIVGSDNFSAQFINLISHYKKIGCNSNVLHKKVNEYDQEIPQSQTADNSIAPRRRATRPSRDTRESN